MRMSKKEMAAFMAQQTFEYNPNVEMEDVGGESAQETNQSLNVSFYDEESKQKLKQVQILAQIRHQKKIPSQNPRSQRLKNRAVKHWICEG